MFWINEGSTSQLELVGSCCRLQRDPEENPGLPGQALGGSKTCDWPEQKRQLLADGRIDADDVKVMLLMAIKVMMMVMMARPDAFPQIMTPSSISPRGRNSHSSHDPSSRSWPDIEAIVE